MSRSEPVRNNDLLLRAGQLMVINAILHGIGAVLTGFSGDGRTFAVVTVIYGLFAWGLLRQFRWLAYIVFLTSLMGTIIAYGMTGSSNIPNWVLWAIVVVDVLVAMTLFRHIWRRA